MRALRCFKERRGRSRGQRSGYTLVELLVICLVLLFLASLWMTGIQRVRTPARKTQCSSQLKNVVLAMHNFESAMGRLPGKSAATKGRWSMYFDLLPFIEQRNAYDRLNHQITEPSILELPNAPATYGALDAFPLNPRQPECARSNWWNKRPPGAHRMAVTTKISCYVCPSDFGPEDYPGGLSYVPVVSTRGARTAEGLPLSGLWPASNEGVTGRIEKPWAIPEYAPRMNPPSIEKIPDGSSHTIGIVERIKGRYAGGKENPQNVAWLGAVGSGFVVGANGTIAEDNAARVQLCHSHLQQNTERVLAPGRNNNDLSGVQWLQYTCAWMGCANTLGPPNSAVCSAGDGRAIAESGIAPPSSYHSGGANCAFMDGTVRFIPNDIDLRVFHALGTIDGSEPHLLSAEY